MLDTSVLIEGDVVKHVPTGRLYVITKIGRKLVYCYACRPSSGERKENTVAGYHGRPFPITQMEEADYMECEAHGLVD